MKQTKVHVKAGISLTRNSGTRRGFCLSACVLPLNTKGAMFSKDNVWLTLHALSLVSVLRRNRAKMNNEQRRAQGRKIGVSLYACSIFIMCTYAHIFFYYSYIKNVILINNCAFCKNKGIIYKSIVYSQGAMFQQRANASYAKQLCGTTNGIYCPVWC